MGIKKGSQLTVTFTDKQVAELECILQWGLISWGEGSRAPLSHVEDMVHGIYHLLETAAQEQLGQHL